MGAVSVAPQSYLIPIRIRAIPQTLLIVAECLHCPNWALAALPILLSFPGVNLLRSGVRISSSGSRGPLPLARVST